MLCRKEEQRRESHATPDEQRMFQPSIEAASKGAENGDGRSRPRRCQPLRTTSHLTIDQTNPSLRA